MASEVSFTKANINNKQYKKFNIVSNAVQKV